MPNLPVSRECCATCKYWSGERKILFDGSRKPYRIECESASKKCLGPMPSVYAGASGCRGWSKWEKL